MIDKGKFLKAVERASAREFDWAENNCALAAANIVRAYSGVDYAAEFREGCAGMLSAMRIVKRAGGLAKIVDRLGLERIAKGFARPGDVALYAWEAKGRRREALGIVIDYRVMLPGVDGVFTIPIQKCEIVWRVKEGGN